MLPLHYEPLRAKIRLSQKWCGSSCAKPATPNPLRTPVYPICKGNTLLTAQRSAKVHDKHHLSKKILNVKKSHEEKWFLRLSRIFLDFHTVFLYFLCPKGCYHTPIKPNDWKKCIRLISNWILKRLDRGMYTGKAPAYLVLPWGFKMQVHLYLLYDIIIAKNR